MTGVHEVRDPTTYTMRCAICDSEFVPKRRGSGQARSCSRPECKRELRKRSRLAREAKQPTPQQIKRDVLPPAEIEKLLKAFEDDMPSDTAMLFWSTDWYHPELTSDEIWGERTPKQQEQEPPSK